MALPPVQVQDWSGHAPSRTVDRDGCEVRYLAVTSTVIDPRINVTPSPFGTYWFLTPEWARYLRIAYCSLGGGTPGGSAGSIAALVLPPWFSFLSDVQPEVREWSTPVPGSIVSSRAGVIAFRWWSELRIRLATTGTDGSGPVNTLSQDDADPVSWSAPEVHPLARAGFGVVAYQDDPGAGRSSSPWVIRVELADRIPSWWSA